MEKELQKEVTEVAGSKEKSGIQKIQAPSGFKNILSNPPTVLDVLGKIVCHPFIMLGGMVVIIYVIYKAWRSGFFDSGKATLSGTDTDLMLEIKALRNENKKLKRELALLVDKDPCHTGNERNLLSTGKKKVSTAYLD
jgi:hypothetical protein